MTKQAARRIRAALLRWYRREHRDLPWRRTRDPYAIWISETMLQQTRVDTAIPYYLRFLERFPDVATLADADSEDVYAHWAGLGYYSRARNLQRAARQLVEDHGGRLPDRAERLRELPGVGRYTAGAVASIAFGRREPVVDGNVARVLARLLDIRDDVRSTLGSARLWQEAATLASGRNPGDLNQALMELGATVCTPRAPRCAACPLQRACAARRLGNPESLPVKRRAAAPKLMRASAVWLCRRGRGLALRRAPGGLLGGLWELPGGELRGRENSTRGLLRTVRERIGLELGEVEPVGEIRHAFTHRKLQLQLFSCTAPAGRIRLRDTEESQWVTLDRLHALALGTPTRKALRLLVGAQPRTRARQSPAAASRLGR